MRALAVFAALAWLASPVQAQQAANTLPGANTPLTGCVEGRALRIVNGAPSCATTAPPTLSACGAGTIDATATDYIGQVTIPASLSSCTIVLTKLYAPTFICLMQSQTSGVALPLGSMVAGSNGTNSTITVPLTASLSTQKFGYICGPG